jgi:hypothetical protein
MLTASRSKTSESFNHSFKSPDAVVKGPMTYILPLDLVHALQHKRMLYALCMARYYSSEQVYQTRSNTGRQDIEISSLLYHILRDYPRQMLGCNSVVWDQSYVTEEVETAEDVVQLLRCLSLATH